MDSNGLTFGSLEVLRMPKIVILANAEGMAKKHVEGGANVIHLQNDAEITVGYLSHGMASGKPSVGIMFQLPEQNTAVIVESSVALFLAVASAMKGFAARDGFEDL